MKKLCKLLGVIAIGAVIAIGLAGCDNGTTSKGEYHLKWGVISISYSTVQSTISTQGWSIADNGTNWALGTGSTATTIYTWCMNTSNIPSNAWLDSGDFDGAFEDCVNFSSNGVGAPAGLKNSSSATGANVPLAGIFDGGSGAVLFYITKN